MDQTVRLRFGVGIPVTLKRDPDEGLPTYTVGLRAGPFADAGDAQAWEEAFIRAATLGWDQLSQTKDFPHIEARTITGPLVEEITGIRSYAVSASSPGNMRHKRMIVIEVSATAVEKYLPGSAITFDINPEEDSSPEEAVVDLVSLARGKALKILKGEADSS